MVNEQQSSEVCHFTVLISKEPSDEIKPQDEYPQGAACFPGQEAAVAARDKTSTLKHTL